MIFKSHFATCCKKVVFHSDVGSKTQVESKFLFQKWIQFVLCPKLAPAFMRVLGYGDVIYVYASSYSSE